MTEPLGEFELIARVTRGLATSAQTVLGVGDDCAILRGSGGSDLLVTCDMLVEGVHFRQDTLSWAAVGAKALTCGLSDVAAMGGRPQWALISLGIPQGFPPEAADALYHGLADQARRHHVDVVGGDTVRVLGGVTVDVTVIGAVGVGLALRRSAARAGDAILVTGRLGSAAAGLDVLLHGDPTRAETLALVGAHQWPIPRCDVGAQLPLLGTVGACIDLSDGLAGDLRHVCVASGLGAIVFEEMLPATEALMAHAQARRRDPLEWILGGGEDYELLFTMPARAAAAFLQQWDGIGQVPITRIGEMRAGPPEVSLRRASGVTEPMPVGGWDHLRSPG